MKNSFTTGCANLRKSALEDHQDRKDHVHATKQHNALQRSNEIIEQRILSDMEKGIAVAVRAAHWVVNENLPIVKFESLMNLLRSLETPNLELLTFHEKCHYENSEAFYVFFKSFEIEFAEQFRISPSQPK